MRRRLFAVTNAMSVVVVARLSARPRRDYRPFYNGLGFNS
jgi:hypothetical protein